jgi:hypothetical protein
MNDDANLPPEDRATNDSAEEGAKFYVVFFLVLVPALGITLVAAIVYALWSALF